MAQPELPAPLTGFGASDAAWEAHHHVDPYFADGSAYDPDPALTVPGGGPHFNDRYYDVVHMGGVTTNYSERFEVGTSLALAKALALREFPSDARVLWFATKDICSQMAVTSPTLGALLGAPAATALVGFYSANLDDYKPSVIANASFTQIGDVSTPQAAGGC